MGLKLSGIMLLLMLGLGGAFYWYYNDTQERMAILNENNAKLNIAVQTSEAAVASLQRDYAAANQQLNRVNEEFAATRAQNQVLADKLASHDLGVLGSSKPALVERVINNASEKAGRCFEILSGKPLTQAEKEAKDGKAFNSECPWLWPGASRTTAN
jgi:uncharacterized protein HemX